VAEILCSFVAELMKTIFHSSGPGATGTFLGGWGFLQNRLQSRMPSPSQLFPWGFWGKEADTRPDEGEADSASLK
jgi:hypothetical protein